MRRLMIAVLAVAALLGGAGGIRGQDSGRTVIISAFCADLNSLRAMAAVHKEAFVAHDEGNTEVGDQLYLDFMFNNDDEFRCFDVRLNGLIPFSALVLAIGPRADVPAILRPDCQELRYDEFWTQGGDTVYSWRLDKVDDCGSV